MTVALLILSTLIIIGFVKFQSQKRREKQEENSQEESPVPSTHPISDEVLDTTYFYKEVLSLEEPEAGPFEDQGQAVPEPKQEESPAPKKSTTRKSVAKKSPAKKTTAKKTSPKKTTTKKSTK